MTVMQNYKYISYLAFFTATSMLVMVLLMFLYPNAVTLRFEQVVSSSEMTSRLLESEGPLRLITTFDNLFLVFAFLTFVFIANSQKNDSNKIVIYASLVPIFVTFYLDLYENHHIIAMLAAVKSGLPITQEEINLQSVLSLIKFHGGNVIYLMLGFFLPKDTKLEKIFRYTLLFILLPVSIIRYTYQDLVGTSPLNFAPMIIGFYAASYIFYLRFKKR